MNKVDLFKMVYCAWRVLKGLFKNKCMPIFTARRYAMVTASVQCAAITSIRCSKQDGAPSHITARSN